MEKHAAQDFITTPHKRGRAVNPRWTDRSVRFQSHFV